MERIRQDQNTAPHNTILFFLFLFDKPFSYEGQNKLSKAES